MAPRLAGSQAAITEPQCKPMQRAAASVSQALTDGGLMSQEYFQAEAGHRSLPRSRPSRDSGPSRPTAVTALPPG